MNIKPFVKWAGGKSQLLNTIRKKYPTGIGVNINSYCEPFVGGGAVLFDILKNYKLKNVYINDINSELINTYIVIQNNVSKLIKTLKPIQDNFISMDLSGRKEFYYLKREEYNKMLSFQSTKERIHKAALFLFLNKTCFNGLYRVNSNGGFNVPMGSYKNPQICNCDNLREISSYLQKVIIKCGDYSDCLEFIDNKTFVYIDPPYRPLNDTSSFTAYTDKGFSDHEQIRLRKFVDAINMKKAYVIISNSDPKNSDDTDHFFDNLYHKYKIERVIAKRMINCNGENRGEIKELLICNH